MAYIRAVKKNNGDISYKAEIVIKKVGVILHRESKTFLKKKLAVDWAKRREVELQENDVYKKQRRLPIVNVINDYLTEFPPEGRTKKSDLKKLLKTDLVKGDVYSLNAKVLIEHIKARNKSVLPQTAANDLIWLKAVLQTMNGVNNLGIDLSYFDDARFILRREGLLEALNNVTVDLLIKSYGHYQDIFIITTKEFFIFFGLLFIPVGGNLKLLALNLMILITAIEQQ